MNIVIYPAPCLFHPHQLQGRLASLLVLYAYVIYVSEYECMYIYTAVYTIRIV